MPTVSEPTYEQSATEPGTVTMRWKVNMAVDLSVSELGEAFQIAGVEADNRTLGRVAEAIMTVMARKVPQAQQQIALPPHSQAAPPVQEVRTPPPVEMQTSQPGVQFPITAEVEAPFPAVQPSLPAAQSPLLGVQSPLPQARAPTPDAPSPLPEVHSPFPAEVQSPLPEVSAYLPVEAADSIPGAQAPLPADVRSSPLPDVQTAAPA